jgi:hypothetical protein
MTMPGGPLILHCAAGLSVASHPTTAAWSLLSGTEHSLRAVFLR